MNVFREPTGELLKWTRFHCDKKVLTVDNPECEFNESICLDTYEAEALLEVLLDICPNAKALAHNFLLERQKAEYMKGGGS